jgi:D-amino peptidase
MKVYLMTDLEGVAGVADLPNWCCNDSKYYELGKKLMTMEVNAAIEGFFDAGADEIVVQDGHGEGAIDITLLDSRAKLQRGWEGPYPFGLDSSYDVMAWVGQHPKAGTEYGHLCHTGSMSVLDCEINGISVGEYGKEVFLGQLFDVTPIFASGCLAFTKEAKSLVEGIETVSVKEGVKSGKGDECTTEEYTVRNSAAIHLQPEASRRLIKEGAKKALERYLSEPESFKPVKIYPPYSIKTVYRASANKNGGTVENGGFDDLVKLLNLG